MIAGDVTRLEQILVNLVTNAPKYAPDSERIEVSSGGWNSDGRVTREAELQVRDYGRGIPAADLPHLFTRFYQVRQMWTHQVGSGWGSTSRASW